MSTITADQAAALIAAKAAEPRIVVSGNGAVPWTMLRSVDAHVPRYRLFVLNSPVGVPDRDGVTLESAFVGPGMRRSPRLAYYPSRLSHVPHLFRSGKLAVDAVVVHTSVPYNGKVSLGCEINILCGVIEAAQASGGLVIAQTNPTMPYTFGDGEYDLDMFDAVVEADEPVRPLGHGAVSASAADPERAESAAIIGALVSDRVGDGATLQLGIGEIPDATLGGLSRKKDLGIWTEMLSDGVLSLAEAGALDPDRVITASFVYGSLDLYRWIDRNERVRVLRTETVNSPARICQNYGMTSINTALQVDLLDQANASRIKARIHSGFGGQTDFTVGAMHAPHGQAIMALRSWHPKAQVSTIVPLLDEPVTSFQHTCVITEHGVAEMMGCSEKEQAANLIDRAAHPGVRAHLWDQARQLGLA
ncbi:acetyl-CoA hydrolase/transferase family protein [Austwickia sp. TVS 96-490-7B]|uniref:acetyl-CoA hydrolase/transferase family protein n=1 Tax=Austwickia sp. TVS 96-490-7B TaxID=2830843 RepID=UPI0021081AE4|nr:acetyl-CoA hydrolase/transferase C-terminal domain-containing protein [Austwickia sp. TVS 96-490-7B]